MKQVLIIFLIIIQTTVGISQELKEYKDYHPNGKLWRTGKFNKDNKQEGEWKYFSENGVLSMKGFWVNGLKNGEWKSYGEDGTIYTKKNYLDDKLNGTYIKYKNNMISVKGQYENDYFIGEWTYYYTDDFEGELKGKIEAILSINDDGFLVKPIKYFNYENIIDVEEESEGMGYYSIGELNGELSHLDIGLLKKIGNWKGYYENGKLAFEGTYNEEGKQEGKWIHYHPNGEIYMEGFYLKGEESGQWKKYYDNKQLYTTENYEVNSYNIPVLIGKINTYYKNGKLKKVSEFGYRGGRSTRCINLIEYNLEGIKISEYKLNNKGEFVQIFNNR